MFFLTIINTQAAPPDHEVDSAREWYQDLLLVGGSVTELEHFDYDSLHAVDKVSFAWVPHLIFFQGMRFDIEYRGKDANLAYVIAPQFHYAESEDTYLDTDLSGYEMYGFGGDIGFKYYINDLKKRINIYFSIMGGFKSYAFSHRQEGWSSEIIDGVEQFILGMQDQTSTVSKVNFDFLMGNRVYIDRTFFIEVFAGTGFQKSWLTQEYLAEDLLTESLFFDSGITYFAGAKIGWEF